MNETIKLIVFTLNDHYYALPQTEVARVVRAAEITPFPADSTIIKGLINIQGIIMPVIDLRAKLELPSKNITSSNQFVITTAAKFSLAILVESVTEILDCSETEIVSTHIENIPHTYIAGIVKQPDKMILLFDTNKLFSEEEKLEFLQAGKMELNSDK